MGEEEEASRQIIFEAARPFLLPCAVIMHASGSNAGREREREKKSYFYCAKRCPTATNFLIGPGRFF